ncbi:MAG TPA: lysophospholipid acyltransferase family protein [Kofleriaceae bacterium]|nr:lysophospholipid acyltransferase family protein [Kofleriaceae bacterium]
MSVRTILRSAAIWGGMAGVVMAAFPPMMLGYPLVLVDPDRALSDWYFRTIGKAIVRANPLWRVEVVGKEKLERGGPFVLVVNHQSFADLVAMCFLDHPTKYLGKASVFRVPVLGWGMTIAGQVPVVRGDRESGKEAVGKLAGWLRRGVSVALFPEGTRSESGAIGGFRLGAFRLAIAEGRPVVPVVLSGARELLPKRSVLFEKHAVIRLQVLDAIATAGRPADGAQALADEVRARMVAAFAAAEPRG